MQSEQLNCSVLLAEDTPTSRLLITRLLERQGMRVTTVADGQAAFGVALDAFRSEDPFDVVLMDMQMPVLDGHEATRRLRDSGYSLPIIALTAGAMKEDRERCFACGCDDYATKPVDMPALLRTIRTQLERGRTDAA